jgi:hypothetical protein
VLYPAVLVVALISALGWIPILFRFARAWRARGNPISFAIAILVLRTIYVPVYLVAFLEPSWPLAAATVVDFLVLAIFYAMIFYTERKFPDVRTRN